MLRSGLANDIGTGSHHGDHANGPAELLAAEVPMPKLGIAFFGMMVGGAVFLISGLMVFATIVQVQDRTMQALAPAQPTSAQYAQLELSPQPIFRFAPPQ